MEKGDNGGVECKAEEFREWLIENERSENTISNYMDSVKQFFEIFPEVSKKNMIEFKRRKLEENKPKTAAIRICRYSLPAEETNSVLHPFSSNSPFT